MNRMVEELISIPRHIAILRPSICIDSDGFTEISLSGSIIIIISDGTSAGNANDIGLSIIDIIPFCDDGTVEEI